MKKYEVSPLKAKIFYLEKCSGCFRDQADVNVP